MLNVIVLVGRTTREPELRYLPNGTPVVSFTLAVQRPFKNQQGEYEADFVNVVEFGKHAETTANKGGKGLLTLTKGRLQIRSFDGQDGQRRWITEVVADAVRFLSPKGTSAADMGSEVDYSDDENPF